VHINSGAAGLALSLVVKRRTGYGTEHFKPHSLHSVFLGTTLLWFGWFGFNAGSELAANSRTASVFLSTNLAACTAGLTWAVIDRRYSAFGFCSGVIAGLVAITPACGFVPIWSSVVFGVLGSMACQLFLKYKKAFGFDDALDVFGVHGVAGITGCILTGIFASKSVIELDGSTTPGGWIDGNFVQVGYQLAGVLAGFSWSFVVTYLLCYLMIRVGLDFRLSEEDELLGTDHAQLGESAYDYIEKAVMVELQKHVQAGLISRIAVPTADNNDPEPSEVQPCIISFKKPSQPTSPQSPADE